MSLLSFVNNLEMVAKETGALSSGPGGHPGRKKWVGENPEHHRMASDLDSREHLRTHCWKGVSEHLQKEVGITRNPQC